MRSKHTVLKEVVDSTPNQVIQLMGELIDCYIQEARISNDDASADDFRINQGRIQLGRTMKSDLKVA